MAAQSKTQFYRNGTDTQKKADITVDLRRPDVKKVQKWSAAQKIYLLAYLEDVEVKFNAFKKALKDVC